MAIFRRRSFVFKLIIGIPIAWFTLIGFIVVIGGGGLGTPDSNGHPKHNPSVHKRDNNEGGPILEVPNPDRLIKEEQRRRDAERFREQQEQDGKLAPQGEPGIAKGVVDWMNDKIGQIPLPGLPVPPSKKRGSSRPTKAAVKVDPNAPGENGKGVTIEKDKLSPEERKLFDQGFQRNAFNEYASSLISLHRSLPDVRDSRCKQEAKKYASNLPDTSVIICFHNEAMSVLLRTVHSVLDRSPPELINEIILVDDFSDLDHLRDPLQEFCDKTPKVKLVRTKRREGLIRARLLGATHAHGVVLTYLDSHCEATEGWLEPLLDRIGQNRSNVVTPVIDVIDDETLRYQYSSATSTSIGGFDWNLQFNWHAIPPHEKKRRSNDVEPVRSPTMAGGLFSIHKQYFEHLGTYDPGMDIWGGENLELSFRIWMCGGTLEIVPCSHVGHIFRKRNPNAAGIGGNFVKKNSVRLAEVWMDEYKTYYYERFNGNLGEYGDVSARRELRNRLQCKPFDWFIKHIYPELFIPGEALASGAIQNKFLSQCLDSAVDAHSMNKAVKMWPCHNQGGNQYWMLSQNGEIRRDEGCMDYAGQFLMIYPCHSMKGNQEWVYGPDNTLRHKNTNTCVEMSNDGKEISMKPCTGIDRQIWYWKRKDSANKHRQLLEYDQHR